MTNIEREIAELLGAKFEKVNEGTYAVHWKGTVGYGCSYGQAMYHLNMPNWATDLKDALQFCSELALLHHYHLIIEGQYERNRYFTQLVPFGTPAECAARKTLQADGRLLPLALAQLSLQVLRIVNNLCSICEKNEAIPDYPLCADCASDVEQRVHGARK